VCVLLLSFQLNPLTPSSETDLDEVLQTDQVFINVSKGALAPKADLQKAFGAATSTADIVREILQKGELQVGEKERGAKHDQVHAEVISIVASKCVDPGSKRVYTPTMVEKALAELATKEGGGWHGVKENKSAKAQALEAIKALVAAQIIPIARARMRLRITGNKKCKEKVMQHVEQVEAEEFLSSGDWECTGFVEPGKYKTLADIVGAETKGRGRVEILDTAVSVGVEWQIFGTRADGLDRLCTRETINVHLMNRSYR